MKLCNINFTGALLFCMLPWSPLFAKEYHSLLSLDAAIERFLGKEAGQVGGARHVIDRRLKLQVCPEEIAINARDDRQLIVRCAPLGWRISIPLLAANSSKASLHGNLVMVARGQPVLLVVNRPGFQISRQMIADRSGKLGDIIPVRSARRSQPIVVEITGAGRVSLPGL